MLRVIGGAVAVAIVAFATGGIAQEQQKAKAQKAPMNVAPMNVAPKSATTKSATPDTPAVRIKRLESDLADLANQNSVLIERVRELEAEITSLRESRSRGRSDDPTPPDPPAVAPGPSVADKPAPQNGTPKSPEPENPVAASLDTAIRTACGLRIQADSGAPGAKDLIVVSVQRRAAIDASLRASGATAVDIEALNVDACFSVMGTDHILVAPPGRRDAVVSVIGGDGTPLSQWLMQSATASKRARLAPSADCTLLLDQIGARAGAGSAVWVEQDMGASRCERDSDGSATVNPNKFDGYSGVIVLKVQKD
jgi:hypothetical protein